jgi:hypothetical protein
MMKEIVRLKLAQAMAESPAEFTRRDARLPQVPDKAHAVVGMRRSGKTTFLKQCRNERLAAGKPKDSLVYFSFDDERLADMDVEHLRLILEEYYLLKPEYRDSVTVTFFLDEIQIIPGWEQFARRIMDSERIELFVSGSSAHMLSREVATSFRGRALETRIYPFGFREFLRHRNSEPEGDIRLLTKAARSMLESCFREYLVQGGFPEAQGVPEIDRLMLLQSYVDTVILRDIIERHDIRNAVALREMIRQQLASAASPFSVHKCYNDLKSRGIAVSKDLLHSLLAHIEDSFLIRLVPIHTESERQRQVNPRKIYPIDQGMIPAFDRSGKANLGQALETAVLIELERRGFEREYLHTEEGFEVDFLAKPIFGEPLLIQVCADLAAPKTRQRELRALEAAIEENPGCSALLLTQSTTGLDSIRREASKDIRVMCAWEWMLGGGY